MAGPFGDFRLCCFCAIPLEPRVHDDNGQLGRIRHSCAVLRKGYYRYSCAPFKFALDQLPDRRLDVALLVERGTPVSDDLLQGSPEPEAIAVSADLSEIECAAFQRIRCIIDARDVEVGFP